MPRPYWHRFQLTLFALGILCTIAAILYLILSY